MVHPRTPGTVSYNELMAKCVDHLDLRTTAVYNRNSFQRREQFPDEGGSAYTAPLRKLVTHCNFGTSEPSTQLYANLTMPPTDVMLQFPHPAASIHGADLYFEATYNVAYKRTPRISSTKT